MLLLVLCLSAARPALSRGAAIVGDSGCAANVLSGNDDGSSGLIDLPFTLNFYGTDYGALYVNNNGNVTFDSPLGDYTPFAITADTPPIIAPFLADVDTRPAGSGPVTYGATTFNGRSAFCANWPSVGYYDQQTDKLNDFQLLLVDRGDLGDGDFDAIFNYDRVRWETGDASGGVDGLGGTSAGAGFSNGDGSSTHFYQLAGSLLPGAFLDSNAQTGLASHSLGSSTLGRYVFEVRNGRPHLTSYGIVIYGPTDKKKSWQLPFQATHTYTFSEPDSCFSLPGCNVANLKASIRWGDGSSSAIPADSIACTMQPPPEPYPGPAPTTTMDCNASAGHRYTTTGAYAVPLRVGSVGLTVKNEAEIGGAPSQSRIRKAVGELVAYDSAGPGATFYPCTATVLTSVSQTIIVTAAHCVADILDGDGHVFAHLKFAPEHFDETCVALASCGTSPFGVWRASPSTVTIVPNVGTQQRFDWAFVNVSRGDGVKVGKAVGGGLAPTFGSPYGAHWSALGLPSGQQVSPGVYNLSFKRCEGDGQDDGDGRFGAPGPPGPDPFLIENPDCSPLTSGSSGGPWIGDSGRIGAVNKATGPDGLIGTYLGTDARTAFLQTSLP